MNGWCRVFVLLVCVSVGYGEFSAFIQNKLDCYFCLGDFNADRTMTISDYVAIVERSYPRCPRTPEQRKDVAVRAWNRFPRKDITRDDFMKEAAALINTTDMDGAINPLTEVMYELWNCDLPPPNPGLIGTIVNTVTGLVKAIIGTGKKEAKQITEADLVGQLHDLNVVGDLVKQASKALKGLDINGDSRVSLEEYQLGVKNYLSDDDQTDGSKYFFGDGYSLDFASDYNACHPHATVSSDSTDQAH